MRPALLLLAPFPRAHQLTLDTCRSEYQILPLHSVDDLRELAARPDPPAGLEVPLPAGDTQESAHELMLARLAFELAERKRCARLSPVV